MPRLNAVPSELCCSSQLCNPAAALGRLLRTFFFHLHKKKSFSAKAKAGIYPHIQLVTEHHPRKKFNGLCVSVALKLRSLRLHPPRLCRLAVFLIQTNVSLTAFTQGSPNPSFVSLRDILTRTNVLSQRSLSLPSSFVSLHGILIQTNVSLSPTLSRTRPTRSYKCSIDFEQMQNWARKLKRA